MKLKISGIEQEIDFNNYINILEIEDKKFFRKFLLDINDNIINNITNENIILTGGESLLNMSDNMMIIFDIFNIDFNSKIVLSKLYEKLSKNVYLDKNIDEDYKKITDELICYTRDKLNDLPFEYNINCEINFKNLLKLLELKIDIDKYEKLEEKIMFFIDLISEFDLSKILVLPNIKNYFEEQTLIEIYKYSIYKDVKILIVENNHSIEKLEYENKLYIDENFDDFDII